MNRLMCFHHAGWPSNDHVAKDATIRDARCGAAAWSCERRASARVESISGCRSHPCATGARLPSHGRGYLEIGSSLKLRLILEL